MGPVHGSGAEDERPPVGADPDREPPVSRRARLVARLVVVGVVVWLATAAVVVVLSFRDVSAGMAALEGLGRRFEPAELANGQVAERLRAVNSSMVTARDRLRSPLLAPFRFLPFAGRQLRSATTLSTSAAAVSGTASAAAAEAQRLLERADRSEIDRVTSVRLIRELATRLDGDLADVPLGPERALIGPLAEARDDMATGLAAVHSGLQKGAAVAGAVESLLTGPRRYLLFAANNAEMRAGSGMLLSVGELETGNGSIRLGAVDSVNNVDVPPTPFNVDQDLAGRWGWLRPGEDWRNLLLSPRFEPSARLAADMWVAAGHRPVDGVLVIDPVALEGVLEATGPVTVDDRTIAADDVVDELTHDQYVRFPGFEQVADRRDTLGRIARASFDAFDAGRAPLSRLAEGLAGPMRGRHFLAWSAIEAEQAGWRAAGVDGALTPESMLVSILNRGGNKLDPFLRVSADLAVNPDEEATRGVLTLELENTVPVDEPPDVVGPHPGSGVGEGVYLGILTVHLPGGAGGASFDGVEQLAVAGPDGPCRVVGFQLQVARGERRTVVLRFTLPGSHGSLRVEGSARVPGIRWAHGASRWTDGSARTLRW